MPRTSPLLHYAERTDARICRLIAAECRPPRKADRRFAAALRQFFQFVLTVGMEPRSGGEARSGIDT